MSIGVSDIIASGSFHDAILEPLGYTRVFEDLCLGDRHQANGYGVVPNEHIFTIKARNSEFPSPSPVFHIAFSAPSCGVIEMWHRRRVEKVQLTLTKVSQKFGQTLGPITLQRT